MQTMEKMGSCYLHSDHPIERICLHCNSGICSQCTNEDNGKIYCPHCMIRIRQKRDMAKQTLVWLVLVGTLIFLFGGWATWMHMSTPSVANTTEFTNPDSGNTPALPKSTSGLLPPLLAPRPPIKLTPIQQKIWSQLKKSCNEKKKKACRKLAFFYVQTRGARGYTKARTTLQKACRWKDGESCAELAQMHHLGMGVAKNPARAAKLYQISCELSYKGGCANLGILYMRGMGIPKDGAKARKLFAKACKLKSPVGCRNLAVAYFKGLGGSQNLPRARRSFQRACRLKDKAACFRLGLMYEKGLGVRKNRKRSRKYYKHACTLGLSQACNR